MEEQRTKNKVETKTFSPDVYKIKHYLETNCVGKANKKTYNEIMDELLPEVNAKMYHSRFKKVIQILRCEFDRYVCSDCRGYYLPSSLDEYSTYNINQAKTHIKTCLAQGVSKNVFYDLLNNTPSNNVVDGQLKLKVTPYAKEEVTRISKDNNSNI